MFNLHKHIWEEQERFYAPPVTGGLTVQRANPTSMERLLMGVTTIKYVCRNCCKIKTIEILGKETAPLHEKK